MINLQELADTRTLGDALTQLRSQGGFELLNHWKQGEFHHDVVLKIPSGEYLIISTNCNGGVKDVLAFDALPDRSALWHWRCPDNPSFSGELPKLLGRAETEHYFDPNELLKEDARSELRPEFRERQEGGGWVPTESCGAKGCGLK